jgi:hypothetical protein
MSTGSAWRQKNAKNTAEAAAKPHTPCACREARHPPRGRSPSVWTPTPLRRAMSACAEPAAPSLLSAASDSPHSPPVQSVAAAESPPIHRVRRTHAWQVAVRTPGGWVDMLLYPLCALALLIFQLLRARLDRTLLCIAQLAPSLQPHTPQTPPCHWCAACTVYDGAHSATARTCPMIFPCSAASTSGCAATTWAASRTILSAHALLPAPTWGLAFVVLTPIPCPSSARVSSRLMRLGLPRRGA